MGAARSRVRSFPSSELKGPELEEIRRLLERAFDAEEEGFTDEDWQHALGGRHFVLQVDDDILGHASVVPRQLEVAGRAARAGYVEAVAITPPRQRGGFGTEIMLEVAEYIRDSFELGALSTGSNSFYERLGWITWKGPSFVRTPSGLLRTPDDDGTIMVLSAPGAPQLDSSAPISCDWRPGDVW
jgi:aminoglycoside 2'-N-acetyltransferase I